MGISTPLDRRFVAALRVPLSAIARRFPFDQGLAFTALGFIYGLLQSAWLWGMLPSEWLKVPTFPNGILLTAIAWLLASALCALPFCVWGCFRTRCPGPPALAAILVPSVVTFAWQLHPVPVFSPGYYLAYTPLDSLACWGGVHTLTWLILFFAEVAIRFSALSAAALIFFSTLAFCSLYPSPQVGTGSAVAFYVVQPGADRSSPASPEFLSRLMAQVPHGAFAVLPEGVYRSPRRASFWRRDILGKTVLWGEIRSEGGRVYNTLVAVSPDSPQFVYRKRHLAPGAEWFGPPGLDSLAHRLSGWPAFSAGEGPSIWQSPLGLIALGICYDSAWRFDQPARFALVVTNDDWLGTSFTLLRDRFERIRAIELGAPVLRVSNRSSRVSYPDRSPDTLPNASGVYRVLVRLP